MNFIFGDFDRRFLSRPRSFGGREGLIRRVVRLRAFRKSPAGGWANPMAERGLAV
jgi:hypothetical protein